MAGYSITCLSPATISGLKCTSCASVAASAWTIFTNPWAIHASYGYRYGGEILVVDDCMESRMVRSCAVKSRSNSGLLTSCQTPHLKVSFLTSSGSWSKDATPLGSQTKSDVNHPHTYRFHIGRSKFWARDAQRVDTFVIVDKKKKEVVEERLKLN